MNEVATIFVLMSSLWAQYPDVQSMHFDAGVRIWKTDSESLEIALSAHGSGKLFCDLPTEPAVHIDFDSASKTNFIHISCVGAES